MAIVASPVKHFARAACGNDDVLGHAMLDDERVRANSEYAAFENQYVGLARWRLLSA
jgi:hypothetical protein